MRWEGFCAAAGVGISANVLERVQALVDAKVDVVVLDSAHGHSENVLKCLRMIKEKFPDLQVIAGKLRYRCSCQGSYRSRRRCCQGRYRNPDPSVQHVWFGRYRCSSDHSSYGLLRLPLKSMVFPLSLTAESSTPEISQRLSQQVPTW